MRIAIGIDTGGTCTDAVVFDYDKKSVIAKSKTLTTREDLSIGISKALDMLPEEYIKNAALVCLSTTLATNACVEDKGGRAKLVIFGLTDELMERLKVEETYGIKHGNVRCVDTHSSADGQRIDEPNWDALMDEFDPWIKGNDYMAAAELYGPTNGATCEKKFKAIIKEKYKLECVCANELTDKVDVIQRGATALLNARLLPIIQQFIDIATKDIRKRGCNAPIMVVRSDGSFMSTDATAIKPVETILSGPAASILAGKLMAGDDNYMVVDMGGTTSDVSMVVNGRTKNVGKGIRVGNWKTSVEGVFVDTFALGGDSTIRNVKGELTLFSRRCVPLCTAATKYSEVLPQLVELSEAKQFSKYPLYEFLCLVNMPSSIERYNKYEVMMLDLLKDGPCSLFHLTKKGIDLYSIDTTRLEDEGIIIRFGLTPTDLMHIKGDYVEYDKRASLIALEYILRDNRLDVTEYAINSLVEEGYDIVEEKMYCNLVRIMLTQDYAKKFEKGLGDNLEFLIKESWRRYKSGRDTMNLPSFRTNMLLLGVGAPTHVFLPEVAKALGTKCILPQNAEVGNAIGAVMAELVVVARVEISQWQNPTIYYMVHDANGSTKYENISDATIHARKSAELAAVKEAKLRGATGDIEVKITQKGYVHEKATDEKLLYGGIVTAEARFSIAGNSAV